MLRHLLLASSALLLVGCGSSEPTSDTRVVVFGVDGLDPELLQERIDRGILPNFARLVEDGLAVADSVQTYAIGRLALMDLADATAGTPSPLQRLQAGDTRAADIDRVHRDIGKHYSGPGEKLIYD